MKNVPNLRVYRFMAIDPGSSNLGIALYEMDFDTQELTHLEAFSISAVDSLFYNKSLSLYHGDRHARFEAMKRELKDLFEEYRPAMVICESPFFNRLRPSAFSVLTELVQLINQTLWQWNNQIPFFKVDPPTAKKAVGAKGNAKKEEMLVAVSSMKDTLKLSTPIEELDEHAVDACAIGYYGYQKYILGAKLCLKD